MEPSVESQQLPVHEYWLEHKRAMALELEAQRSTMLYEIANSQRSALLGIELVRSKLEEDIESFYVEFRRVLNAVTETLNEGWRKIQTREKQLFQLQQQMNDGLATHLKAAKEQVMRNAELELSYSERREQLEQWAANCQDIILKREEELGATARKLDSDMSAIMIARKRLQSYDQQVAMRPGTVAKIVPAKHTNGGVVRVGSKTGGKDNDDAISAASSNGVILNSGTNGGDEGVIQVPCGAAIDLEFQLEMNPIPDGVDRREYPKLQDFANVPCTVSYLEGKNGAVWGTVQTLVTKEGRILLEGVRIQGNGGSSHILLISMPRCVSGNVHPIEVRVHLYTIPKIDVVGAWKPDVRALVGRIRLRHAEPFSVANKKMQLQLVIRNEQQLALEAHHQQRQQQQQQATIRNRSHSQSSQATTAVASTVGAMSAFGGGGRAVRAECEGDAQGDFSFHIALPGHVWEELESSSITLEFRTPNLITFPALEHRFEVSWMHVNRNNVDNNNGGGGYAKIPMFRHPPDEAEPLSISALSTDFPPKGDLITDLSVAESGNLLIVAEVSNKVTLYRYDFPHKWTRARTMLMPAEDAHIGGVSFSRSGNCFAVHDTTTKSISVWLVAKVLKHAPADASEASELEPPEFTIDYSAVAAGSSTSSKAFIQQSPPEDLLATHFKPIEDVLGTSLLVYVPATGLHLYHGMDGSRTTASNNKANSASSGNLTAVLAATTASKRPQLLVEPRGQNAVRTLFHKALPQVGSVAVLGYDNGEVIATATNAAKATGKRVQFRFAVVKGSPIAAIADGPTPDSFLCCTICTLAIVKTQPTWSVLRCSYVTSSPIAAVAMGFVPAGVTLDSDEKDGCAIVAHSSGLVAAVGIVTGSVLGSAILPDVGEQQQHQTVADAQCASAGDMGVRLVAASSLKPAGWEVKLISPSGEPGAVPSVPAQFVRHVDAEAKEADDE